jgi:ribosome-binding factor A
MARVDRLASLFKREIADIVRKEVITELNLGLVSIVNVKISKDYAYAKVSYSHLGTKKAKAKVHEKLTKASRYIKGLLGKAVRTGLIPELTFVFDDSLEKGVNLVNRINEITENDKKA